MSKEQTFLKSRKPAVFLFDKKSLFAMEILNSADEYEYTSLEFRGEDWTGDTNFGHQVVFRLSEIGFQCNKTG